MTQLYIVEHRNVDTEWTAIEPPCKLEDAYTIHKALKYGGWQTRLVLCTPDRSETPVLDAIDRMHNKVDEAMHLIMHRIMDRLNTLEDHLVDDAANNRGELKRYIARSNKSD